MGSLPRMSVETRLDVQTATREFATATLGWRDLPADDVVTVEYRFSTPYLHDIAVTYNDTTWSCTVLDPVDGLVSLEPCRGHVPDGATRRAIRSALDRVGIRVTRDERSPC